MKIETVQNCDQCIYFDDHGGEITLRECRELDMALEPHGSPIPSECPLRPENGGPVTIRLADGPGQERRTCGACDHCVPCWGPCPHADDTRPCEGHHCDHPKGREDVLLDPGARPSWCPGFEPREVKP